MAHGILKTVRDENLFLTVAGNLILAAISGVTTWLVARRYYEKAGLELRRETQELRSLVALVLRGLEEGGIVKLNRDPTGQISGFVFEGQATMTGAATVRAEGEVVRRGPEPDAGNAVKRD
jgi:hypothetical protein